MKSIKITKKYTRYAFLVGLSILGNIVNGNTLIGYKESSFSRLMFSTLFLISWASVSYSSGRCQSQDYIKEVVKFFVLLFTISGISYLLNLSGEQYLFTWLLIVPSVAIHSPMYGILDKLYICQLLREEMVILLLTLMMMGLSFLSYSIGLSRSYKAISEEK